MTLWEFDSRNATPIADSDSDFPFRMGSELGSGIFSEASCRYFVSSVTCLDSRVLRVLNRVIV